MIVRVKGKRNQGHGAWQQNADKYRINLRGEMAMRNVWILTCLSLCLALPQLQWDEQDSAPLQQSRSTSQNQSVSVQSSAQWMIFSHHHHWSALMNSGMCQSSPLCNSSDLYICTTVWLYSDIQNCRDTEHWYHHLHVQIHCCCSLQTHQELNTHTHTHTHPVICDYKINMCNVREFDIRIWLKQLKKCLTRLNLEMRLIYCTYRWLFSSLHNTIIRSSVFVLQVSHSHSKETLIRMINYWQILLCCVCVCSRVIKLWEPVFLLLCVFLVIMTWDGDRSSSMNS